MKVLKENKRNESKDIKDKYLEEVILDSINHFKNDLGITPEVSDIIEDLLANYDIIDEEETPELTDRLYEEIVLVARRNNITIALDSVLNENTVGLDFQDIAAAVKDAAGWLGEIQIDNAGEIIQILVAERDDKLEPKDVNKILSSGNTWDAFYDLVADIEDNSWDWFHSTKEEVLRSVMEEYPELDEDFLLDHLYINYDTENLLNQEYPMFFNVNTGDGNYDYTLNPNYSMDEEEIKDLSNEASVVWLAGTQGYSREDVVGAILNGDYKGSKFLKSLRQEYIDTLSQMNSIIFLGTMSLKDMMDSKETGSIKVPANTVLGFWDGWSGSGSTIGIELEKPVVVPYEIRDRIYAAYGKTNDVYTPQEIYGLISRVYDADFILEVGLRENRKTRPIKHLTENKTLTHYLAEESELLAQSQDIDEEAYLQGFHQNIWNKAKDNDWDKDVVNKMLDYFETLENMTVSEALRKASDFIYRSEHVSNYENRKTRLMINESTLTEGHLINTNEFINKVINSHEDYTEKTIRFFGGGGVIITLTSLTKLYVTDIDTNETVLFATLETDPRNEYDWGWELRDKLLDLEIILGRGNWKKELKFKDSITEDANDDTLTLHLRSTIPDRLWARYHDDIAKIVLKHNGKSTYIPERGLYRITGTKELLAAVKKEFEGETMYITVHDVLDQGIANALSNSLNENKQDYYPSAKDSITEDADNIIEWKTYAELGKKLRQLGFDEVRVRQIMDALQDDKPVKNVGNLKFKRIKESVEGANNIQISKSSKEFEAVIREYYKKYGQILQVETMIYDFETGKYYMYNESTDYSFTSKRLVGSVKESNITKLVKTSKYLANKQSYSEYTSVKIERRGGGYIAVTGTKANVEKFIKEHMSRGGLIEDALITKAQILSQLAKHFKDRFNVFIYGNNVEISSDTVASSMLFDEIYRKNIFGKLSNDHMSAPYDEDFVLLKLDKMKIGPVYLDESKKVEESTDSSFETIFWGIYDNEFDLPFNHTLEYIEKYYSSKIWGENEYANLENLSPEEKRDIIEFAKKEALNWDNMDLYNSHARYKSTEEINNQLYRFFGIENERIHD